MIAFIRSALGKLAALAILGLVAYATATFVIAPLTSSYADLEDGIASQRALLGGLLAATSKAEAAQPGDAGVTPKAGAVYLEGESDAIRVAGLQSKLSETAQAIGAHLSSTQAVPSRVENSVRLIGVQTQFRAPLERLQKFLFDLETARPALFVDTLHVSHGPEREGEGDSELDVRVVVLGAAPREVTAP